MLNFYYPRARQTCVVASVITDERSVRNLRCGKVFIKMNRLICATFLLLMIWSNIFSDVAQSATYHAVRNKWLDTEGLYYLDAKQNYQDTWAFVITRDGQNIPPKENDPDAPIKPGFYVGSQRYRFKKYSVTRTAVFFETETINGRAFRFLGKVRRETVCEIENVPELRGRFVEINGSKQKQTQVRFGHAVVC